MRFIILILIFLLSGPNLLYAKCTKDDVCSMVKTMNPFSILDKCPSAGPFIVECKKTPIKKLKFLPKPKFVDNGNGTITDKVNKLLWVKKGFQKPMELKRAKSFASTFALEDKMGWRLPTLPELRTLLHHERARNSSGKRSWVNPIFDDGKGHPYWTSTTCEEATVVTDRYQKKICQQGTSAVWLVHFNIGAIFWHHTTSKIWNTWLVNDL